MHFGENKFFCFIAVKKDVNHTTSASARSHSIKLLTIYITLNLVVDLINNKKKLLSKFSGIEAVWECDPTKLAICDLQ